MTNEAFCRIIKNIDFHIYFKEDISQQFCCFGSFFRKNRYLVILQYAQNVPDKL